MKTKLLVTVTGKRYTLGIKDEVARRLPTLEFPSSHEVIVIDDVAQLDLVSLEDRLLVSSAALPSHSKDDTDNNINNDNTLLASSAALPSHNNDDTDNNINNDRTQLVSSAALPSHNTDDAENNINNDSTLLVSSAALPSHNKDDTDNNINNDSTLLVSSAALPSHSKDDTDKNIKNDHTHSPVASPPVHVLGFDVEWRPEGRAYRHRFQACSILSSAIELCPQCTRNYLRRVP